MHLNRLSTTRPLLVALLLWSANAPAVSISADSLINVSTNGNSYAGVGDAGDRFAPQDVVGSHISQITGTIGSDITPVSVPPPGTGTTDTPNVDAFRFFFSGGDIQFTGMVSVSNQIIIPLDLALYARPADPIVPSGGTCIPGNPCISFLNLVAGNYILEAIYNQFDPPFTIQILDPTAGGPQAVSAPVPEPGILALFGLGLAGLAARRRTRISGRIG